MLKIDLHLHTVASGHAQNTILEYITQARKLGMHTVGISDHAPSTDSLASEVYFLTLRRMPKKISGIRLLNGIEANIVSLNGEIDLADDTMKKLDYVMVGFHRNSFYRDRGEAQNTKAMINALKRGKG